MTVLQATERERDRWRKRAEDVRDRLTQPEHLHHAGHGVQHRLGSVVNLLALDPGSKNVGWAYFSPANWEFPNENITLTACGLLRGKTLPALYQDGYDSMRGYVTHPTKLVMERPQVYQRKRNKTKGDPNALISIAIAGGVVAGAVMDLVEEVELVKPAEWKLGQTPKEIENVRAVKTLSDRERVTYNLCTENVPASLLHNVLDAVAVGLFALGRKKRRA